MQYKYKLRRKLHFHHVRQNFILFSPTPLLVQRFYELYQPFNLNEYKPFSKGFDTKILYIGFEITFFPHNFTEHLLRSPKKRICWKQSRLNSLMLINTKYNSKLLNFLQICLFWPTQQLSEDVRRQKMNKK